MCGKQLDWAPFRRIDEGRTYEIIVGILDFMVFLYFVSHCLRTLDLGVLSNKMQRRKDLTVAAIYKLDRLAVVYGF